MIISELLPGDELEYEVRLRGAHRRRKRGIVIQVTTNHVTLDLGKYKDSFSLADLESGEVRIITEEGDFVSWDKKEMPPANELWNAYLKCSGNIKEMAKQFEVSKYYVTRWLMDLGWPTTIENAKEFIAQKISEWPDKAESFMVGMAKESKELINAVEPVGHDCLKEFDPDIAKAISDLNVDLHNKLDETRQLVGQSLCEFNDTISKIKEDAESRNESMFDVIRLQQKYSQDVASLMARITHLENRQSPPITDIIERLELIESFIGPDGRETLPLLDQKIVKAQTDISELTHAVMLLHEAFINYPQTTVIEDRMIDLVEKLFGMMDRKSALKVMGG